MIHQTKGIVLNYTRYAETSIVVHVYTELFGPQPYMINGVRSAKNKGKSVFMQPLSILDMQVYHNTKKEIQRVKEFKVATPFVSIPFKQSKRSIAFFITEVMNKAFKEEAPNAEMFKYVENAIVEFDNEENCGQFHLTFLAGLTRFLGFFPDFTDYQQCSYFDLQNGCVEKFEPSHSYFLQSTMKDEWAKMFLHSNQSLVKYQCPEQFRDDLINNIIDYYRLHLHDFRKIKSLEVLHSMYHS